MVDSPKRRAGLACCADAESVCEESRFYIIVSRSPFCYLPNRLDLLKQRVPQNRLFSNTKEEQ